MLETLLVSPEHTTLSPSSSSVFQQYLSLDPFLITGTALAFSTGYTHKNLLDLAIPVAIVSADNLFSKVADSCYTFEQLGGDVKMEALFVLGAYIFGLITNHLIRTSSRRRHHL